MGPDEVAPDLRAAVDQCLLWNDQYDTGLGVGIGPDDLAVAAAKGDRVEVLFLNRIGYLGCSVQRDSHGEPGGGVSSDRWPDSSTMPGPVQWLSMSSSEADGGDVSVSGRVAARVQRLVLEHGNGRSSTARIRDGAFGLITDGGDVGRGAALVAYDADGREIFRRDLLMTQPGREPDCRTIPKGPACPAPEPWSR